MTRDEALKKLIKTIISRFHSEIDRAVLRAATDIYNNDLKIPSNKASYNRFKKIFDDLNISVNRYIKSGFLQAWNLSNNYYDNLTYNYLAGKIVNDTIRKSYMAHNLEAAKELWTRKEAGMNISQRVWKISTDTRIMIEKFVASDVGQGFLTGRSASETATLLKEYLKEPNKRFRRIRDEAGKLQPSGPMAKYESGQGVYKSSYKNALRLAATETNMAYRVAEHERIQQLDFVMGIEVVLSAQHDSSKPDVCDEMAGEYPKEFVFVGWHPSCYCSTRTILLPEKEFDKYLAGSVNNIDQVASGYKVTEVPDNVISYLKSKQETFDGYENKPFFLKDNFIDGNVNKGTKF